MAKIREFHDFKGEDVVLLLLTPAELALLRQELPLSHSTKRSAITLGECRLLLKKHRATGVNLSSAGAEICLQESDLEQFEGLIDGLLTGPGPGHQYMDISWPVATLMISVDEYPPDFGN
jgi:hypothetical protein